MPQRDSLDVIQLKCIEEETLTWKAHKDIAEQSLICQHNIARHAALTLSPIPDCRNTKKRLLICLQMVAQPFEACQYLLGCFRLRWHIGISLLWGDYSIV